MCIRDSTSTNQVNQFYDGLTSQIAEQNAARGDAMNKFANEESNKISAINAQNTIGVDEADANRQATINQFNSTLADARQRFNVENQRVIDQSNVQWRRALNTANTAGQNAVNQANAMNSFNMSNQGLSFLWQEMRDAAKWEYEAAQNYEERQANLTIAALGNEAASDAGKADILKTLGGFALDIWRGKDANSV